MDCMRSGWCGFGFGRMMRGWFVLHTAPYSNCMHYGRRLHQLVSRSVRYKFAHHSIFLAEQHLVAYINTSACLLLSDRPRSLVYQGLQVPFRVAYMNCTTLELSSAIHDSLDVLTFHLSLQRCPGESAEHGCRRFGG